MTTMTSKCEKQLKAEELFARIEKNLVAYNRNDVLALIKQYGNACADLGGYLETYGTTAEINAFYEEYPDD